MVCIPQVEAPCSFPFQRSIAVELLWILAFNEYVTRGAIQGGDLTRPYPARRPPEAAPCHLISISDCEVLGLFMAFSTLTAIAMPPGLFG